ncbi:hypothetical protein N0V93_001734 [Gnomoniopsis smithogilvyi]|uniref:DUF8004 domain-containing protein n=1 Tax=Gnomoniopsis smithogilvyi TaxID=1191159 RepID=A0A9W9D2H0_9PEZI|nr:hypothetical protein N0V93_001734 [Gnomoniopsis smithogilvyi]
MSGRSAHVRKKITETKKGELKHGRDEHYAVSELPSPLHSQQNHHVSGYGGLSDRYAESERERDVVSPSGSQDQEYFDGRRLDANAIRPLDDFAYGRARKPTIKAEDMTGIAKSGVRSAYDKKSDNIRKGLSKAFGFGNKKSKHEAGDDNFETARALRPNTARRGSVNGEHIQIPHRSQQVYELPGESSAGPPSKPPPNTHLPPLPAEFQARRWIGNGRPVQRWNKLRKDPELWDPNGDVLIYLCSKGQNHRADPSLRLSSHIIESTDSRHLITMLREGVVEDGVSLSASAEALEALTSGQHRQTMRSYSDDNSVAADGGISYELYFPPPPNVSKADQLRYQLTTRNVFAVLCHVSLVGLSLHQALSDLLARLEDYVPQNHVDNVLTLMSYISARGIDDVRNDPETAIGLLAWSEDPKVRWEEAWREAFVHVAGLYGTSRGRVLMESSADFKKISPITRALLERASLETQLRVQAAEERLAAFSFADMWPMSISIVSSSPSGALVPSPAKDAADRLQRFLVEHYRHIFGGRWPPPPPATNGNLQESSADADEPIWLTRTVVQALQKDFGALYDYLVNRDIIWDMSETRPSRKWLMVSDSGNKAFEADTVDLPMTDILIEFDNKQRFPHIPHPYPLVPESIPAQSISPGAANSIGSPNLPSQSSSNFLKRRGNRTDSDVASAQPATGHRAAANERRIQLAYTESTNVYLLGSDFTPSELLDAFVKFEKADRIGDIDPSLARRARWVLLYGILQTLASVSVDAPNVRFREGVAYHLCPQLKGARLPPWSSSKKAKHGGGSSSQYLEAAHELSHCWVVPAMWTASNTSASEDDDAAPSPPTLPPLVLDHGFPYPPPLAARSSRATDSDAGSAPTWLNSTSSQSTTRATTPATSMNPLSPVFHHHGALSRKTSQKLPATPGGKSSSRARIASGDGDWSPVRRSEMGFERAARRDASGASEAGSSERSSNRGGQQRSRRKKNMGDVLGMDGLLVGAGYGGGGGGGSESPREQQVWDEYDDAETVGSGEGEKIDLERPLLSMSLSETSSVHVAPVFKDFDALGVDDIMP